MAAAARAGLPGTPGVAASGDRCEGSRQGHGSCASHFSLPSAKEGGWPAGGEVGEAKRPGEGD